MKHFFTGIAMLAAALMFVVALSKFFEERQALHQIYLQERR